MVNYHPRVSFDSFRVRVFALVLAALVPAVTFGVLNELKHREALRRDIQRDAEQSAVLLAAQINNLIGGINQTLTVLSRSPDVIRGNTDACNRYVADLKFSFNGKAEIGVADPRGTVVCLSKKINGVSIADRLYFREALSSKTMSVGEYVIGRVGGAPAIHFGYPVQAAGGVVSGVAFIPLNLSWLAEHVAKTPLPERSSITLADRNGIVLVRSPESAWVGKSLPSQWQPLLHAPKPATVTLTERDGARYFVGYVPVGEGPPGVFVAVGLAEDVVMASALSAGNRAMLLIGLSVLLAFALTWVVSEVLVHRPLLALTRAAQELKSGNLGARVPIQPHMVADFEALGRTFNDLASVLEHDEKDRSRAQAAMREARDLAEAASRSKTTFLAALGHDLRQPLQSMAMNAALLTARLNEKTEAMLVSRIERSISRLAEVVNAVLDLSQLDAGLARPRLENFGIGSLLEPITDEFGDSAAAKAISLVVVPCSDWVRSDLRLLRRITENLVGNAVKYTPSGGTVTVSCHCDASHVYLSVADNGPGIPKDKQAFIWDEFWQLGNANRDHAQGLGLGLAIVRRLCALLGHEVSCESNPGVGSTFTVALPKVEGTRLTFVPFKAPELHGNVLLVDDDSQTLASTGELLEAWGLSVVRCASAEDALIRLGDAHAHFDVVITDYRLTGLPGSQVIIVAKQRYGELLCILLTGEVKFKLPQELPPEVVTLFKPVSPVALASALHKLTEGSTSVALGHTGASS